MKLITIMTMMLIGELYAKIGKELTVLIISMIPVIELRGAIPAGMGMGLTPIYAAVLAFIGSMIPVPFILLLITPIFNYLKTTKLFSKFVHRITAKTMKGTSNKVEKYGFWGIALFVAIPLPGTGVWTGSLGAVLLGIPFKKAFLAVLTGDFLMAIIVLLISTGMFSLFG